MRSLRFWLRRRRSFATVVAVGLMALPFVVITAMPASSATTYDVNGAGVFQLDGNVCNDAGTVPPWDWANQNCTGVTATAPTGLFNSDFTQALAPGSTSGSKTLSNSIICNDAVATPTCLQGASTAGSAVNDLAFITGGSKDGSNPPGNWQCTTKPVTPKDEIDNAYAAIFSAPVTAGGTPHVLLYMAIERGITNGTSNAGFWLTQNGLSCDPSSGAFSGDHKSGDLLLFATFNSGGAICPNGASSTACVDAFAWSGGATGSLSSAPVEGGEACSNSTVDLCGMVNTDNITPPWRSGSAVPANGFFEVGMDLTNFYAHLSSPVPCLSTFLADTRASGSQGNAVSSALHDYISGSFSNCQPHVVTTPSASSIELGGSITDTAAVTGTVGFPAPTGTVTFYACGPLASAPSTNGPNCTTAGTKLTNTTYPTGAIPLGTASPSFTPTAAGRYCFLGVYSGDGNYGSAADSASTECFTVIHPSTTLKNTAATATPSPAHANDTITFTFYEKNDGNVDLTNPHLSTSDSTCNANIHNTAGDTNLDGILNPGEEWTFVCTTSFSATGTQTVTATGHGTDPLGNDVTYWTSSGTPCTTGALDTVNNRICNPNERTSASVLIINPSTVLREGVSAVETFTYLEKNSGDSIISTPSVTSDCTGLDSNGHAIAAVPVTKTLSNGTTVNVGDTNSDGVFDPGEIWEFQCTKTVTLGYTSDTITTTDNGTGHGTDAAGSAVPTTNETDQSSVTLTNTAPNSSIQ